MLQPTDRRLLFDALAPPTGFKLDFAVGTTYTLDLFALLSAPVAFAFSDWQDRDGRPDWRPIGVTEGSARVCRSHLLILSGWPNPCSAKLSATVSQRRIFIG